VLPSLLHDNPHHDTEYGRLRAAHQQGSVQKQGWNRFERKHARGAPLISPIAPNFVVGGHSEYHSSSPKSSNAATIKRAASKYRKLVQRQCKPDNTIKSEITNEVKRDDSKVANARTKFNEAVTHIFTESQPIVRKALNPMWDPIRSESQMSDDLHQAIGAMKGITEGICVLIKEALTKLSDVEHSRDMNSRYQATLSAFFEKEILMAFGALLLRAPEETRRGLSQYLSDKAFSECFDVGKALDGQLYRVMTATEKQMIGLRTDEERVAFESITCILINESNESKRRMKMEAKVREREDRIHRENDEGSKALRITEQLSPRFGTPFPFTPMYYQYSSNPMAQTRKRKLEYIGGEDWNKPPMKKHRARSHAYRPDGTPRKPQENPCKRKLCRNPLQTDGVTTGCGKGTHPRTLCQCWLLLGFRKGDWKNGKIETWLKEKFPDQESA